MSLVLQIDLLACLLCLWLLNYLIGLGSCALLLIAVLLCSTNILRMMLGPLLSHINNLSAISMLLGLCGLYNLRLISLKIIIRRMVISSCCCIYDLLLLIVMMIIID